MLKLQRAKGFEIQLSVGMAYMLKTLNILTVKDFLLADSGKLAEICRVDVSRIDKQRGTFVKLYTPQRVLLSKYQKDGRSYTTGVEALDKLLSSDPFATGSIWEICGITDVGKTQFCHTLALNFATNYDGASLYIDTKCDFSAGRIRQMIHSRDLSTAVCARLMQKIRVQRVLTAPEVIGVLEEMAREMDADSPGARAIKLIIIDSLPAICMRYTRESDRLEGRHLLAMLGNRMQRLAAEHNIAFLLVNLANATESGLGENLTGGDSEDFAAYSQDENSTNCVADSQENCGDQEMAIHLDEYWSSVVRIRLSIERDRTAAVDDDAMRLMRVLKSSYTATGDSCAVRITDGGII